MSRHFSRDSLIDIVFENLGGEVIKDEIVDHSRWSVCHSVVFKSNDDGLLYATSYSTGATEQQMESPWEYDEDPIECRRVEAVQVTKTVYKEIKKET